MKKRELENLIPANTNGMNRRKSIIWSNNKLPLKIKSDSVIKIPILNTLFSDGLNSCDLVFLYSKATGGPPIAAIIPKIPEKVPAKKEFTLFLFMTQPKKEPTPAINTIKPTEIERYLWGRFNRNKSPIGPPISRPNISGLTLEKSTWSFSL